MDQDAWCIYLFVNIRDKNITRYNGAISIPILWIQNVIEVYSDSDNQAGEEYLPQPFSFPFGECFLLHTIQHLA